jgi:hypothetical protein
MSGGRIMLLSVLAGIAAGFLVTLVYLALR